MIVNNPSTFLLRSMQLSNEKINSIKDVISTGDGIFDPVTFVFSGLIFSHSPHERRFEFIKITIQSASVIALTNSCECFENFSLPWVSSLRLRTVQAACLVTVVGRSCSHKGTPVGTTQG